MNQVQTTLRGIYGNIPEPGDLIIFPRHAQLRVSKVIRITPKNSIVVSVYKETYDRRKYISGQGWRIVPTEEVSWKNYNKPELHNGEQYIYYVPEFLILNKQQKI